MKKVSFRSGSNDSMRMKRQGYIITGFGIIRQRLGAIHSRIRLDWLGEIRHCMVM